MADGQRVFERTFLQIMLDRRYMPLSDVRALVSALNQKYDYDHEFGNDAELLDFINGMNPSLSSLHLKLSQIVDEETGRKMFVLCNTLSSDMSRNPSFNEQQMAVFRRLVSSIVESGNGCLDSNEAECVTFDIPNCSLTPQQTKNTIQQLIRQKYLRCSNGNISLTPSALSELQPYISATMSDKVSNCFGCKALCLRGKRCPHNPCEGRVHKHCAETIFARNKNCRVCGRKWSSGTSP